MLQRILSIISFDPDVISAVAQDEERHSDAYFVLLGVAVLSSALAFAFPAEFGVAEQLSQVGAAGQAFSLVFASALSFAFMVAGLWIGSFLYDLVASWLGGSGSATGLFRVLAHVSVLGLLSYLPVVGWLVSLWVLALDVYVIKQVQQFSLGRAVATMLILVAAVVVLVVLAVALLVGIAGVSLPAQL